MDDEKPKVSETEKSVAQAYAAYLAALANRQQVADKTLAHNFIPPAGKVASGSEYNPIKV